MIRLAVRVRRDDAELVLAELLVLAPNGVEESSIDGDVVEYAVYGAEGELPDLPDLRVAAGDALVEIRTSEVADDWAERWREFHRPVTVGDRLVVRAPWHPPAPEGVLDLVIDPGRAFGTGGHETTRLCLELLLEAWSPGPASNRGPVVDVGCGSGVLAIAAALLGYGPVLGVDHDRLAVEATAENARVNGAGVDVRRHDLLRDGPAPGAPLVLANLLRPLLLRLAADGFEAGARPCTLIASGLLRAEADEVAGAFADRLGLHESARLEGGEWAALLLRSD